MIGRQMCLGEEVQLCVAPGLCKRTLEVVVLAYALTDFILTSSTDIYPPPPHRDDPPSASPAISDDPPSASPSHHRRPRRSSRDAHRRTTNKSYVMDDQNQSCGRYRLQTCFMAVKRRPVFSPRLGQPLGLYTAVAVVE
ncbi:hypothetical protein J6590_054456 [Homalodisca vitripennis]|nr:hypothetical protein J6590_054456 [Homalodisca vitripennis]